MKKIFGLHGIVIAACFFSVSYGEKNLSEYIDLLTQNNTTPSIEQLEKVLQAVQKDAFNEKDPLLKNEKQQTLIVDQQRLILCIHKAILDYNWWATNMKMIFTCLVVLNIYYLSKK